MTTELRRRSALVAVLVTMFFLSARGEDAPVAQAWSAAFSLDSGEAADRFAHTDSPVAYSPAYSLRTADAASYVIVRKVEHADTAKAVTSVVQRCAAGASGDLALSFGADDARTLRLLHTAYDGSDRQVGETLVSDVGFAYLGTGAETTVDTRPDSLQRVAEAGGPALLAYSTDWATNGTPTSVAITCVCDRYRKGTLVESVTNSLFAADAPAAGDYLHAIDVGNGGTYTLSCSFLDAAGEPIEEPLTASYRFKEKWGMLLLLK